MGENLATAAACTLIPLAPPLHNHAAMRTRAALLFCLLPSVALGQSAGSLTVAETSDTDNGGQNDGKINIAECSGTSQDGTTLTPTALNFTWTLDATPAPVSKYKLYATYDSCPTGTSSPPTNSYFLTPDSGEDTGGAVGGRWPTTGNLFFITDIRTPLNALGGTQIDCAPSTTVTNVHLCVSVLEGGAEVNVHAGGTLVVDTRLPATPAITSVEPGDSALTVHWSAGAGGPTVTYYTVTATPVAPDANHLNCNAGGAPNGHNVSGPGPYRLDGLTNDACYDVRVSATSEVLNAGDASDPVPGTPRLVDDFWRRYAAANGREQGGCGGGAGALALLALAPLAPRLRRRRP